MTFKSVSRLDESPNTVIVIVVFCPFVSNSENSFLEKPIMLAGKGSDSIREIYECMLEKIGEKKKKKKTRVSSFSLFSRPRQNECIKQARFLGFNLVFIFVYIASIFKYTALIRF